MINITTPNMAKCPKCNLEKLFPEFVTDKSLPFGIRNICKKCHSTRVKELDREKRKDPEYREKQNKWVREYRKRTLNGHIKNYENKKKLNSLFGGKCNICGYNKCQAALEFHHLDPSVKEFGIGYSEVRTKNFDKLAKEASKCILICNRCHRELHHYENQLKYEERINARKL